MYQPETNSKNFSALLNDIDKGTIKIPQFQRDFVWSKEKSAKLIDSIIKGYPVGTFIIWKTKESLRSVRNIGGISLPDTPSGDFAEYVLDGQQRVTSIYASLKGLIIRREKDGKEKEEDFSEMYIDLNAGDEDDIILIDIENKDKSSILKLRDLLYGDLEELVNSYRGFIGKISEYKKRIESYNFTIVSTREIPIDVATEIFTRLNTGGKPLTNFEIMVAKTFDVERNFDLSEKYDVLIKKLSKVNYQTIADATILQTVATILTKECKKNVILKLEKENFINTWDEAINAVERAVDYFRIVLRIKVSQLLPYNALIVPFAYFFHKHKEKPSLEIQKYLQDFFWRVSLSERYSSSLESKIAQDIKRMDKILKGELPKYDYLPKISVEEIEANGFFSAGRSYIKAILCLFVQNQPRSFNDNNLVNIDNDWLKIANSKNFHHFFPKAYLKKKKNEQDFYINHIVNITIVDDYLNKKEIRDKAPSVYMRKFKRHNRELSNTMKTHLISLDRFGIWENDYKKFFEMRIKKINKELLKKIIIQNEDFDLSKKSKDENILENSEKENYIYKKIISQGENNFVEFKSSLRWDYEKNSTNKILEYVVAKTICAFLNADGGKLIIGVDDNGVVLGLEKDYQTLHKKNKDGFLLQLTQIINQYLGKEFYHYIDWKIIEIDGADICIVEILPSDIPAYLNNENNNEFFVRKSSSSQPLNMKQVAEYIKLHWSNI